MLPPPTTIADLDAEPVDLRDLPRDEHADGRVDAVLAVTEEGLAGQLEQDALVAQRARRVPEAVSVTAPPRARSG